MKCGFYATYNNKEYETDFEEDSNGNYTLISNDPGDLKRGFIECATNVFSKSVHESKIEKIEKIQTYAIYRNEEFDIKSISRKTITILTVFRNLARPFSFKPSNYGLFVCEKTVNKNEVELKETKKYVVF